MNDDKTMSEYMKRSQDHDNRKLKERIFLLDFDDIDSLLTIWIYESGHYTDCLIKKENICEICQIILDYDKLLGNDLNESN